jgi:hypothetical protein
MTHLLVASLKLKKAMAAMAKMTPPRQVSAWLLGLGMGELGFKNTSSGASAHFDTVPQVALTPGQQVGHDGMTGRCEKPSVPAKLGP